MARRLLISGLLAIAAYAQTHTATAQTFTPPPFPRLGGALISGPFNYDNAQYQAQIARLDLAILTVWPGWTSSSGATMQQVVTGIKAINPKIVITLYNDINELPQPPSAAWSSLQTKLDTMGWWLYQSGPSGSRVQSAYGGQYEINTTTFTPPDSNGENYPTWRAAWEVQTLATPNPAIDGFYTDNVFWAPRVNGDWNRDGSSDSDSNATAQTWYRQGYVAYFNALKSRMPGKYQIGNIADWGQPAAVLTEYSGVLQGGVMEGMIGFSWSFESYAGWQGMMTAYRKMMAAIASPQLVIFHQDGSLTDYQGFRYGFASCLMDNAYYYYSANGTYSGVNWFDEFNASLGSATSQPPTAAWQNGVYRRDFQNGIALVNPKGNGPKTVTLETTYKRLSGTQAPSVNNGQSVTSVTLNDRDGVILLRTSQQSVPDAPSLTVQ